MILTVFKGKLLDGLDPEECSLLLRVGKEELRLPCARRQPLLLHPVSEIEAGTIGALGQDGFTPERIAQMMGLQEGVVTQVMANQLGFTAELRQKFCVLVFPQSLAENPMIELWRSDAVEAAAAVPMSSIRRAPAMRLRTLIQLVPAGKLASHASGDKASGVLNEVEVELRLVACVCRKLSQPNQQVYGAV